MHRQAVSAHDRSRDVEERRMRRQKAGNDLTLGHDLLPLPQRRANAVTFISINSSGCGN